MALSDKPAHPDTPKTPFDFPDDIVKQILVEYYKHEVLIYSKPTTPSCSHFDRKHSNGPLAKYEKYFTRRGCSILSLTSVNEGIREMALPYLARHTYFDPKDSATTTRFLNNMEVSIIRQIHHVVTRAHQTHVWTQQLFQRRFPALQSLTIYENWSKDFVPKGKSSLKLEDARFRNDNVGVW